MGIASINYSGTTATVTTKAAHGRFPGQWITVSGALDAGIVSTNYNGSFQITAVLSSTQFQYAMPGAPSATPIGTMYIGKAPNQQIILDNSDPTHNPPVVLSGSGPSYTVTLITAYPHYLVPGTTVGVAGVSAIGLNLFNGAFLVTNVHSPTKLDFLLVSTRTPGTLNASQPSAYVGCQYNGFQINGGSGVIGERNRFYNCNFAGPYHDTHSAKDYVARNNSYYAVVLGPYQNMGGVSSGLTGRRNCAALAYDHDSMGNPIARLTTVYAHGLSVGQTVVVSGATISGNGNNPYNGMFGIALVPNPTQLTYLLNPDPGVSPDPFPPAPAPTFGALWQVDRMIIQNNIIELALWIPAFGGSAVAINCYNGNGILPPTFLYKLLVVRGNVIANVDNALNVFGSPPIAIQLLSNVNALVEENIINLNSGYPIIQKWSAVLKYFSNQTPSGVLIQGYDNGTSQSLGELSLDAELAMIESIERNHGVAANA